MENQLSPFNWDFWAYEEEGTEELWYCLLCRTSELDTKFALAKEEIIKKEDELVHLKDFLSRALKERDEAESKCQSIMLGILVLQQQLQQQKHEQERQKQDEIAAQIEMERQAKVSHVVDQHFPNCFDTDHGSGNIITEPEKESRNIDLPPSAEKLVAKKALPEKGKLLQAVMEAGPLLHATRASSSRPHRDPSGGHFSPSETELSLPRILFQSQEKPATLC